MSRKRRDVFRRFLFFVLRRFISSISARASFNFASACCRNSWDLFSSRVFSSSRRCTSAESALCRRASLPSRWLLSRSAAIGCLPAATWSASGLVSAVATASRRPLRATACTASTGAATSINTAAMIRKMEAPPALILPHVHLGQRKSSLEACQSKASSRVRVRHSAMKTIVASAKERLLRRGPCEPDSHICGASTQSQARCSLL